jgi:hypothetical protein
MRCDGGGLSIPGLKPGFGEKDLGWFGVRRVIKLDQLLYKFDMVGNPSPIGFL